MFAGITLLSEYFGLVVVSAGKALIVAGFMVSDDEGFLLIIVGTAATLGGLIGQLFKRFFVLRKPINFLYR